MEKYKIKDICTILNGRAYKYEELQDSGKYRILRVGNFFSKDDWYYSDMELDDNKYCYDGDLLYAWSANFGPKIWEGEKTIYHYHIWKVIPNENVDKMFLYYKLYSITDRLKDSSHGSVMLHLTKSDMENFEIELPKLDQQKKIGKILKNIDDKITLNTEINNNLQELINNIFISKFVNFNEYNGEYKTTEIGDIPINWRIDNFGSVISFSNGYGWDSKDMLENSMPDTYKVFKMGNIKIGGGINKEKTKSWILKEKCAGLEQFLSKKGDVLMCMTDMKSSENPLLGHTALIDRDDEFVINQRVGLIRCDKEIKWPYIYTMTNLPFFISDIRSKAHSGVQVNLTTSGICDTKVLIPDEKSLNEFYKNVTPIYEKIFVLNNEIEYLEQLRDTLLPKLMNGEIDLDNIEI